MEKKYYHLYEDRYMAKKGFQYLDVDIAPSSLGKARDRIEAAGLSLLARFLTRDAIDVSFLPASGFDLALDNRFLHMLVVDEDRERYLRSLHTALKPGAWVMFNEMYREGADDRPITCYGQYLEVYKPDLTTVEERTAYDGETEVKVRIPEVPARFKDEAGYRAELNRAGFTLERFRVLDTYMGCRFYARAL